VLAGFSRCAVFPSLMELRWTQGAAADLDRIAGYLFEHTPQHAALVPALYDAPATC
jgi:plasmid stabilization system protein ParE